MTFSEVTLTLQHFEKDTAQDISPVTQKVLKYMRIIAEQVDDNRLQIAQNKTDIKTLAETCNELRAMCQINKETTKIVVDWMNEMADEVDTQITALRDDVAARFPPKPPEAAFNLN